MAYCNVLFGFNFFREGMAIQYFPLCLPHFDFSRRPILSRFQCFSRTHFARVFFLQHSD